MLKKKQTNNTRQTEKPHELHSYKRTKMRELETVGITDNLLIKPDNEIDI